MDDKGRIAVPARFRAQLDDGAFVSKWVDGCLAIFPRSGWDELAEKVSALRLADADARTFSRFLFASAFEVSLDRQGRLVVPAGLRDWAKLGNEAVVVGSRDHLEIWSPALWDAYSREMGTPDALLEHLTGLGI
ncbi:MAG: division/cell wall cluster transcriptional repressor MraZ [Chloroflexi bacterium]|nr:division/cell wall cluster transcriptional repressor MraZ [Chloroflexota bacterium]